MPARINKAAAAETLESIRAEIERHHLIVKTQPTDPGRVAERQRLLEGLKESIDKKLDRLDGILNLNTKGPRD